MRTASRRQTAPHKPSSGRRQTPASTLPAVPSSLLAAVDDSTRARLLRDVQRTAGNAAAVGLVTAVATAHGGGLSLHGQTDAKYRSNWQLANRRVERVEDCECPPKQRCTHVTGTLVSRFRADVTIRMPDVPGGLTACQRRRVQAFLRDILLPHEREHRRRFKTYDGVAKTPVDTTGCWPQDIQAELRQTHDDLDVDRQAATNASSAEIDPFQREVGLDCT